MQPLEITEDYKPLRDFFDLSARGILMAQSKKTVLLVDDDDDQLLFFSTFLEKRGYQVLTANCVAQALQLLRDNTVDVIVTDILMPRISGEDLIHHLRSNSVLGAIPIVAISASCEEARDWISHEDGPDMFCLKNEATRMLPGQLEFLLS